MMSLKKQERPVDCPKSNKKAQSDSPAREESYLSLRSSEWLDLFHVSRLCFTYTNTLLV